MYRFLTVSLVTQTTVEEAFRLRERYGFSYYDCLIVAAALEARCETLFSEDLHDGQVIDQSLTITNPFR